jgi:hypothetical protein
MAETFARRLLLRRDERRAEESPVAGDSSRIARKISLINRDGPGRPLAQMGIGVPL